MSDDFSGLEWRWRELNPRVISIQYHFFKFS